MQKQCLQCKKIIYKPSNESVWAFKFRRKFCSKKCKHDYQKGKLPHQHGFKKGMTPWNKGLKGYMAGEKNPKWKGGITDLQHKERQTLEYIAWRKEVYQRDHYTCRICGKHCEKNDIVAHHLKLFSEFPELRYSVDNGIVLCRSCHLKLHKNIIKF